MSDDLCPCGQPLHYTNPDTERKMRELVRQHGPTVPICTPWGTWFVPRHYVALHGIKAADIPALAAQFGWRQET